MKERATRCEAEIKAGANLERDVAVMEAKLSAIETAAKTGISELEQLISDSEAELEQEKAQNAKLLSEFKALSEARGRQVPVSTPTPAIPAVASEPAQPVAAPPVIQPAAPPQATQPPANLVLRQQAGPVAMTFESCVAEANYYAICTFDFASLSGDPATVMKFKFASMTDLAGNEYMLESVTYKGYTQRNNEDNNGGMYYTIKQKKPFKAVFKFRNVPGSISGVQNIKYKMRVNQFDYPIEFNNLPISHR
jgi:hypothetical protein